ncbi:MULTISPECIES: Card1-like endonuclease domain-containing protein [unclassified Agarivorans]|uniref:Card1-like endonuclease domain-containing protein n=1 Tax=unclassified Agarivorans TaxID=2636026 RepID=UPI003D7E059A
MLEQADTHIALLDNDPISVVTPFLNPKVKAQRLILLAIQPLNFKLKHLVDLLRPKGIAVHCIELLKLQQPLLECLSEYVTQNMVLNVTQGNIDLQTRLIEWGKQQHAAIVWLDKKNDYLRYIYPAEQADLEVPDKIKIPDFMALLGITVKSSKTSLQTVQAYIPIARDWAAKNECLIKGIGQLNYHAMKSNAAFIAHRELSYQEKNNPQLQQMLAQMSERGLLQLKENRIHFRSAQAKEFCNGFWLEYFCFDQMHQLRRKGLELQDIAMSVEVEYGDPQSPLRNELDVVALINNRLYIVECKTSNSDSKEGQRIIFRLDMLRDSFGETTQAFWVNSLPVASVLKKRAKHSGVYIVEAEDVSDFADLIARTAKRFA